MRSPLRWLMAAYCLLFTSTLLASPDRTELVVSTAQGKVSGVKEAGVASYRGIPYAAPPTGKRRWQPPAQPSSWPGVRDGSQFGNVCPQPLIPGYSEGVLAKRTVSEDCLQLNVWTPATDAGEALPVMVWVLPGGFKLGDAGMPRYNGAALANQGVVVVNFNYRLGMLGQFAHPALRQEQPGQPAGNYHLMDQIAALQWVKQNISAFGGDPENVTLFGMSAGGVSVNYHMTIEPSRGLFHKAISQSSGIRINDPRHIRHDQNGVPSLESEGLRIASDLGISGDDSSIVEQLRALTVEDIIRYQTEYGLGVGGSLNPVVDGTIVTRAVGHTFETGQQHQVPYLTGATNWEGSLLDWTPSADPVLKLLRLERERATQLYGPTSEPTLNNNLYTDFFFGSQRYLATQHAASGQPAYVYLFSRKLEAHQHELPGAAHGAETRYVFDTLDSLPLMGGGIGDFGNNPQASDHAYAKMVQAYWVQFAKTGDPNGNGRPGWPRVSPRNDLLLEFLQNGVVVQRDFRKQRQDFWGQRFAEGEL